MDGTVLNKENLKKKLLKDIKADLAETLEDYSELLSDDELKNVLISLTTIGWKQEDGSWRKL
jgi:hypothetical protein